MIIQTTHLTSNMWLKIVIIMPRSTEKKHVDTMKEVHMQQHYYNDVIYDYSQNDMVKSLLFIKSEISSLC